MQEYFISSTPDIILDFPQFHLREILNRLRPFDYAKAATDSRQREAEQQFSVPIDVYQQYKDLNEKRLKTWMGSSRRNQRR